MHRHKTFYVNEVKEIEVCGSKLLSMTGGEFENPFPVKPTVTDHNLENCESCNKYHKNLIKEFQEKVNKFPNCCEHHKKLFQISEFAVGNYSDVPKWSADKIMFSHHHFMHWIDKEEWYNEITQYFYYCIVSYGSFPYEFGEPLEQGNYFACLTHLIKGNKDVLKSDVVNKKILQERINKILSYLESYFDDNKTVKKDINILLSKYNEWYKIFPFDLDYFKPLKNKFQMTLPIFNGRKKYNKYLGTVSREIHTKESLTEVLIDTTKNIISNINTLSLYEKGKLNDTDKIRLELILEKRKLELKAITLIPNKTNKIYIKTLKKWLTSEKEFIDDIKPFILKIPKEKKGKNEKKYSQRQVAIAYFIKGVLINEDNYLELLEKHTSTKSKKILQKRINRTSDLTRLSFNKTTDTKHLNDLFEAKRLLSGMKDKSAVKSLNSIISTFQSNYNIKY